MLASFLYLSHGWDQIPNKTELKGEVFALTCGLRVHAILSVGGAPLPDLPRLSERGTHVLVTTKGSSRCCVCHYDVLRLQTVSQNIASYQIFGCSNKRSN